MRARALVLGAVLCGCASNNKSVEADVGFAASLTVTLENPVPTVVEGELVIRLGKGRTLEATVRPEGQVSAVTLRALDPDEVLGVLGHGPYVFFVDGAVVPAEGRRRLCVSAQDDLGKVFERCVYALR